MPSVKTPGMVDLSFRIPDKEADQIQDIANSFGVKKSELIRAMVRYTTWNPDILRKFADWMNENED